ncbi:hypothetical protein [Pseudomonas baetica]|uniref:hypothetical protein n=1 Tax=Pseudomonas baetica TaxID=674054 RepID=UPI00240731F1|nr:hypothetical protein [Pseudomonas baetica]MDF9779144.1 hypothetical protein [Pseudomonas baetica]
MTATAQKLHTAETFLARSQAWLNKNPALDEVKRALVAIVLRVKNSKIVCNDDTRKTADALTEFYVENGGDLADLPCLDEAVITPAAAMATPTSAAEPDYGSLYPDTQPIQPLSHAEKQAVISSLRSIIGRPEGM